MTILGHRNESSYQRYDQSIDLQKIVAMSIVAKPYRDGKRRTYGEPFEELDQKRVARDLQEANNPHVLHANVTEADDTDACVCDVGSSNVVAATSSEIVANGSEDTTD